MNTCTYLLNYYVRSFTNTKQDPTLPAACWTIHTIALRLICFSIPVSLLQMVEQNNHKIASVASLSN